jgi:hypothetical protein
VIIVEGIVKYDKRMKKYYVKLSCEHCDCCDIKCMFNRLNRELGLEYYQKKKIKNKMYKLNREYIIDQTCAHHRCREHFFFEFKSDAIKAKEYLNSFIIIKKMEGQNGN